MKKLLGIVVLGLLWCNLSFAGAGITSTYKAGKGPLKVSQNVADVLEYFFSGGKMGKYAEKQDEPWKPGLIVIAYDGSEFSYFTHPLRVTDIDSQHYIGLARQDCKKRSGKECFLFANGYRIVWDNGSDKKRRKLKKKEIMAGKTLQILQELGFYDGAITKKKKIEKKKEKKVVKKKKEPTQTQEAESIEDKKYLNIIFCEKKTKKRTHNRILDSQRIGYFLPMIDAGTDCPNGFKRHKNNEYYFKLIEYFKKENSINSSSETGVDGRTNMSSPIICYSSNTNSVRVVDNVGIICESENSKIFHEVKYDGNKFYIESDKTQIAEKTTQTDDSNDIVQQIKDLKELYDSGVLTEEEFNKAKKKLLN